MSKNKICIFTLIFLVSFGACLAQSEFVYQAKGKRNPFIPLVGKDGRLMKLDKEEDKEKSGLLVDGIIYDKQGISYALVSGKVVGIGDYAGEYRVLKIENDKVVFLKDDQIKEVSINKEGDN
ncbi:MAG: hypothetical protein NTW18_00495 [Candidatus Omnitrophica bacterium]|nr:hypothetical protein [Candidatus Omnitrophota bacterium]